jgi:hypothetical protein
MAIKDTLESLYVVFANSNDFLKMFELNPPHRPLFEVIETTKTLLVSRVTANLLSEFKEELRLCNISVNLFE